MGHEGQDRKGTIGALLMAVGLVSIGAGLSVGVVAASGELTTVTLTSPTSGTSTTFTWTYSFNQNGGHDLSNVAIHFCSGDVLDHVVSASPDGEVFGTGDVPGGHTGFGPGIKFDVTATTGTLLVTFDQAYAVGPDGIFVQSHSGDGQDGDQVTSGDGPLCDPGTTTIPSTTTSTTTVATTTTVPVTTTTKPPTTTTTVPATTTTTVHVTTTATAPTTTLPPTTTTTVPATTTTTVHVTTTVGGSLPTTTVPPTTVVSTTSSTTTTTVGGPAPTAFVLGESETNPALVGTGATSGRLAGTGAGSVPLLVGVGVVLTAVGLALLVGEHVGRPAD